MTPPRTSLPGLKGVWQRLSAEEVGGSRGRHSSSPPDGKAAIGGVAEATDGQVIWPDPKPASPEAEETAGGGVIEPPGGLTGAGGDPCELPAYLKSVKC
jgi:hypothetical protein